MKQKTTLLRRILHLVIVLLVLFVIASRTNGRIMGFDGSWMADTESVAPSDTATVNLLADGGVMINSTRIARDVIGYAGPIPMQVWVREGRVDSIAVMENQETPGFLDRVLDELIPRYLGLPVSEALTSQVDAVTGATYSSECFKTTLCRSLAQVPEQLLSPVIEDEAPSRSLGVKDIIALLVIVASALIPLFTKNKTYRTLQLVVNVLVLGLYAGTFLNFTSMVALYSNGIGWTNLALALMFVVAFLYPLFGKPSHYCAWCCPLGSAQELMGRLHHHKWHLSSRVLLALSIFNRLLFLVLVCLSLSGAYLDWMNYELFSAFIWESASWVILSLAVLTLLLSLFIPRPYCRFVCPTGCMMKEKL